MHTGDDTPANTTPGPGRNRKVQTLPAFAVLFVVGVALWAAFFVWVWTS